jgi:hypothetical protein
MGWEIMNGAPYSPLVVSNDFLLFWPMKVHRSGQEMQTDDKLKRGVLDWQCSQDKVYKGRISWKAVSESLAIVTCIFFL